MFLKESAECMRQHVEFKINAKEEISSLKATKEEHLKTIMELKTEAAKQTRRIKVLELGLFTKDKKIKRLKDQLTTELGMIADDVDNFEQVFKFMVNVNLLILVSYLTFFIDRRAQCNRFK